VRYKIQRSLAGSAALIYLCPAVVLCLVNPCGAQTAYPMLMSLRPVAVQVGQTAEVEVKSRYSMFGAYQVLVSGDGVAGEVAPLENKQDDPAKKPNIEKLKVKFTAAADALPGVRDIRLATPQGVSTVGQLVVVSDPLIVESGKNNDTPPQAQQVALPAAICGAIEKNEDVDFFRLQAAAGQSVAFLVRCARLEDRIHDLQTHADPIITLRTAAGATLAASDNTSYHADPVLAYKFEQAGEYLLEIRDVRYQGNQYWEYCIEAGSRPLVELTYPLAVQAGVGAQLEPLGWLMPSGAKVAFPPPKRLGQGLSPLSLAGEPTNPVPLIVADQPLAAESEAANDTADAAQQVVAPAGINGRIVREGDVDCFAFEAKKGEAFSLEVVARRARSALDSHLRVLDSKGKQLVLNDDLRLGKRGSADSWIENWTAPADGRYVAEVRDVNLRGGTDFPYFLKIERSQPYFELYLDTDKTQLGPGGYGAIFVRVERKNGFTGEVQLDIEGVPPCCMNAYCGRILEGKGQDGCIVLEAASDAAPSVAEVVVTGRGKHQLPSGEMLELTATAVPYQETYQPGGGRGHWPVEMHTVAVTESADIRGITLSTYDVSLKPGESQKIEVTIDRSPGFTANVTLDMLMRHLNSTFANTLPLGVTLNDKDAKSLLAGSATQGYLTLTAAKDATPVEKQQAVVVAHVALNFVMKWSYASRPVTVSVAPK